jgi:cytochrome c
MDRMNSEDVISLNSYPRNRWQIKRKAPVLTKRRCDPRMVYVLTLSLLVLLTAGPSAPKAEDMKLPSAAEGRELSEKLCKGCHVIGAEGEGTTQVGPPTFSSIANKPGQTTERIKGALVAPHPPMPDMQLTNEEMLDIIAYLETLRKDKAAPPLLPPSGTTKPKLPDPT